MGSCREDGALRELDPENNLGILPPLGTRFGVTELGPGVAAPMVCLLSPSRRTIEVLIREASIASNFVH